MIIKSTGSIFDDANVCIVVPVNCVGVTEYTSTSAGSARECIPDWFEEYKNICLRDIRQTNNIAQTLTLNNPFLHLGLLTWPGGIISFPVKHHWRNLIKIEQVSSCLRIVKNRLESKEWKLSANLAFPLLGCVMTGINYEKEFVPRVLPIMEEISNILEKQDLCTFLYETN